MTVSIKHFLEEGGIRSLSEQFYEVPTYSKLHDLGAKLLIENDLDVCHFDLLWDDDQKLENMNTPAMLQSVTIQSMPEVPEVCIFLKLRRQSLSRSTCEGVPHIELAPEPSDGGIEYYDYVPSSQNPSNRWPVAKILRPGGQCT